MQIKIDKNILWMSLLTVLITGVLIWLAFFLQLGKIKETADNIQKEQLDSLVREQRNQKVLEMRKDIGDVEENQKLMNSLLVDKDNAVPFLTTLENIAKSSGATIKITVTDLAKIKPLLAKKTTAKTSDAEDDDTKTDNQPQKTTSSSKKQDYSNQLGFSVELAGDFRSLVDFLTKLENIPYFVRVYNFQSSAIIEKKTTSAVSNVDATGSEIPAPETAKENKILETTLIISVYTNGKK